jgi:hypothetical protein
MAWLLLKELKLRGLVERLLIICPANLAFQWQRVSLNPAVEALEKGRLALVVTSYKTGTCHPEGELRSSWISPAYNSLQQEWSFNRRIWNQGLAGTLALPVHALSGTDFHSTRRVR